MERQVMEELQQEAEILQTLHEKFSDQIHRLQVCNLSFKID